MGFLVPYPDLHTLEEPNTATSTTSSYSEAGPGRPGLATSDDELATLEPVISGSQDGNLVLSVLQGGRPGVAGSAVQLGYRYDTEAAEQVRGWVGCNGITGWEAVSWTTSATSAYFDACVHPDDQRILVAHGATGGTTLTITRFDPTTSAWTVLGAVIMSSTSVALLALPTGRVLMAAYGLEVRRSDDFGSTWQLHGDDQGILLHRMRMAYSNGEILLVGIVPGTSDLRQYASSNGGVTFTEVETITNLGTQLSANALPDGRIVVTYRRFADGFPCARVIASPWSPISDAEVRVIASSSVIDLCSTADPDGLLWAYATRTASAQLMDCYASPTGGETWVTFDHGAARVSDTNADSLIPVAAVSSCSSVVVLHQWVASTDNHDPSIGALTLGGWQTATYREVAGGVGLSSRIGFGAHATKTAYSWLPIELPNNAGWTLTGTAPTLVSPGRAEWNLAAAQGFVARNLGTDLEQLAVYGVRVVSGGSLTGRDIGFTLAAANGAAEYRIDVRHTTTGFRVFDAGAGAILATISVDLTAAEYEFLVQVSGTSSAAFVLYRPLGSAVWTEAWRGTLTSAGAPAANGTINFGGITAASTGRATWRFVCYCEGGRGGASGVSYPRQNKGRPISPVPVPLHAEAQAGGIVTRLSVIGGLGAQSELYTVDAEYDRPARAIYPQLSPSPDARWRTANKSEQIRTWELEENRPLFGEHPGILAIGCNFRTAYLEYLLGVWTTIATIDLAQGFAGINYSLSTTVLTAGAGGVAPARFLQEGELAGGYAVLETGGGVGQAAFPIVWNTAGVWSSSATTRQARIYLSGVTGADATGQCDLVWPSGVCIDWQATLISQIRWRIRIPANQVTPYSYYEAGVLVPGVLRTPGAPPDWTRSRESRSNVRERENDYGTNWRRQKGPPRRSLAFGWAQGGVDLSHLRQETSPDYLGIGGHLPVAAAEDVPWFLEGLQRFTRGGEIPVAALLSAPTSDATLTDPSLWLYGRLGPSIATDMSRGNEGSNEWERPAVITVDEIR
jgi:hypothetical protein